MTKFDYDKLNGLICPWCPPIKGIPVPISHCMHNPFKLMEKISCLENEVDRNSRASTILCDLRDFINGD